VKSRDEARNRTLHHNRGEKNGPSERPKSSACFLKGKRSKVSHRITTKLRPKGDGCGDLKLREKRGPGPEDPKERTGGRTGIETDLIIASRNKIKSKGGPRG